MTAEVQPAAATAPSSTAPQTTTEAQPSAISMPQTSHPLAEPHRDTHSFSAEDRGAETPPFSPTSTTPVLEKDELDVDFAGNVEVNNEVPSEEDLRKVGDLLLLDREGESRPFKDIYQREGVAPRQLVIFIRHFFCGNCQEYLRTLSASITPESLLQLPTPTFITVIGCGRPELIDMYAQATSCPFPIYAEPTRKIYNRLGMTRTLELGSKPEYISSNLFITSMQSIMQGIKTGNKALKGGDFKQVGGEFLFEDGKCVWVHRMKNTRDHCEVPEIRSLLGLDDIKPPMRKRWSHGIKFATERARTKSWGRMRSKSRTAKDDAATPGEDASPITKTQPAS